MNKDTRKPQTTQQPTWANRQQRRAERIIASTAYSAAFRSEVQEAVEKYPYPLSVLFREAREMDQRAAAGRRMVRSPKNGSVREAELVEALFVAHKADELDEPTAQQADLISNILYDISNEAGIDATHPQLVKAYLLAIWDKLPALDQRSYEAVQEAFAEMRELMNGCSDERFDELDRYYNPDYEGKVKESLPRASESQNGELESLREKFAKLERLPENEAIALRLESEIFRLEREDENADEWPEEIA